MAKRHLVSALFWPGFFSVLGLAILIALGIWQLQRLAWKEALIAEVSARVGAPPAALPLEADWQRLKADDYEYRHVSLAGDYDFAHQALVFRSLEAPRGRYGGPGWLVLTPLRRADGSAVIVNRGFVPDDKKAPFLAGGAANGPAQAEVTGLMRAPEPRTWFTPADDPAAGQWFTRDPAAIAAAMKLQRVAPFTLDAEAGSDPAALPEGGETILSFPNNHFSYALTWFGMALALAGVFIAFALRKSQELRLAETSR